jgi:hypothetical protein
VVGEVDHFLHHLLLALLVVQAAAEQKLLQLADQEHQDKEMLVEITQTDKVVILVMVPAVAVVLEELEEMVSVVLHLLVAAALVE